MPIIDVSYAQGYIDWGLVKASNRVEAAFIKLTGEETGGPIPFRDSRALGNTNGARAVGMTIGFYHFMDGARDSATGKAEAEFFLKSVEFVGGFKPGDLRPTIDVEWPPKSGKEFQVEQLGEMVEVLRQELGRYPIIYTGRWYWVDIPDASDFEELAEQPDGKPACPLWIAQYTNNPPVPVEPWKEVTLWQYTNKGRLPGIVTNTVDLNSLVGKHTIQTLKI